MDRKTDTGIGERTSMPHPDISVILPTYNEAGNVVPMADRLATVLAGISWEVIFVDDNSPDGTANRARELARTNHRVRCIRRVGRRGRASACLEGMMAAQSDIVAVMDADQQHDEAILPEMFRLISTGEADFVVGSRYVDGGSAEGLAGIRQKISSTAGRLAKWMLRLTISDPTSGYFATRRQTADQFLETGPADGFNTMLDFATSRKLQLGIKEVPYRFRARGHGESKLSPRQAVEFGALLISRFSRGLLPPRFIIFLMVGGTGVFVHLLILAAALQTEMSFAMAQSVATFVAIVNNFMLNNILTFSDRGLSGWKRLHGLAVYTLVCGLGAISNVGIADWLFANDAVWWFAGLAGAAVSAVWNYAASAALVWRR